GVRGRLEAAMGAEPRADVEDQCGEAQQGRDHENCDDECLAALVSLDVHSARSWVVLLRLPDAITRPMRLTEYGYVAVTVTVEVGCQLDWQSGVSFDRSRSLAEALIWSMHACCGVVPWIWRLTAALRAPA